ncbi:MAG: hypothetical protein ABSB58_02415 [Gemmatimonadales bacterium]
MKTPSWRPPYTSFASSLVGRLLRIAFTPPRQAQAPMATRICAFLRICWISSMSSGRTSDPSTNAMS